MVEVETGLELLYLISVAILFVFVVGGSVLYMVWSIVKEDRDEDYESSSCINDM